MNLKTQKKLLYTLMDLVGKYKIVKEKITYLHNSFSNMAFGGKFWKVFKTPVTIKPL